MSHSLEKGCGKLVNSVEVQYIISSLLNPNCLAMRKRTPKPKVTRQKSIKTVLDQAELNVKKPPVVPAKNDLYFGDCLEVLKKLVAENPKPFIDLIYIDPPFNSKRNYNVLFESIDMKDANAQKHAFADTWSNVTYIVELSDIAELNKDLFEFLTMLEKSKSINDGAVAYLTTMGIRICYMHKLLKDTGSFYLHCDPTMSHYLKLICDMVFGSNNFRNEIIWDYSFRLMHLPKFFNRKHDVLLFYAKGKNNTFNMPTTDWTKDALVASRKQKIHVDENGVEWIWMPGGKGNSKNKLRRLDEIIEGGKAISDVWQIPIISSSSKERLGYPTQKPEFLLERIIKASTNEGDIVADFFCGCGTTIATAQRMKRRWIGADISHLAIKLIIQRLVKSNGVGIKDEITIHGFPKDVDSAKMLARETENGRFGFQEWAIEVLLHGVVNPKKVADGGYDGYLTYNSDKGKQFVLIETKSGNVTVKNIREFIQVVNKQKAAAGIFVCFEVTKEMRKEAVNAGKMSMGNLITDADKIQILTIDDLLMKGKTPILPNIISTFKQAERKEPSKGAPTLF